MRLLDRPLTEGRPMMGRGLMADQDADPLRAVARDYPGWSAWRGVAGLLYARWEKSEPPVVVRAPDVLSLRAQIDGALKRRRRPS